MQATAAQKQTFSDLKAKASSCKGDKAASGQIITDLTTLLQALLADAPDLEAVIADIAGLFS